MATPSRLLFFFLSISIFAAAQPNSRPSPQDKPATTGPSITEHFEGTAKNAEQQETPVTIDLIDTAGTLSGVIQSSYGDFAIVGGSRSGDAITIEFDLGGQHGLVTAKMIEGRLVGTYTAGNDSGSVDVKRTSGGRNAAAGLPAVKTPILILGVYHMDNPGLDEVNTQADDVLTPRRQKELDDLADRLAQFHPTKIAIEAPYGENYWPDEYRKYLAGQHKMGRHEIEQIAFRLAQRLNLPTLYGIDFPMLANGQPPGEKQIATAKEAAQIPKPANALSPEEKLLRESTVTQYLAHLNGAIAIQKSQEGYMINLLPVEGTEIYKKADMVSNWYKRNLRIFANINRITDQGRDRVLVIIGTGHLKLLHDFAADAPYFDPIDPETLLNP